MSKKIGRGALAAVAAGALALSLGSTATAAVVDPDNPIISVPEATVGNAKLHRIADADRILTAVKASQSYNAWGDIETTNNNVWQCGGAHPGDWLSGVPTDLPAGTQRSIMVELLPEVYVNCTVVTASTTSSGRMDIIVSRADDYPDALSAAPLADVLDAPILLHPTNLVDRDSRPDHTDLGLHPAVEAEIARLAAKAGAQGTVRVHILGGTNAVSHAVENAIDNIANVDDTVRYQGANRFQTSTTIAAATAQIGLASGADIDEVNAYVTTGLDFPDALAAGAAAANNDGVVVLSNGTGWDRDGFTRAFLTQLETWVNDNHPLTPNTSEVFAVGGQAAAAVAGADGITTAANYVGADRYQTAELTARGTFKNPKNFAVVSGFNFADALVGSGFIANADGPLLLTENNKLNGYTANYLRDNGEGFNPVVPNVNDGDNIVVFGGGNSVSQQVSADLKALLEDLFALPNW